MGLIKTALVVGGGIYAVKAVTKSHDKKTENQKNKNNDRNVYPQQQYYQPQYQQQQGPNQGQGYDYNRTREGTYPMQDYGHGYGQPQGPLSQPSSWERPEYPQSQYGDSADRQMHSPPAYFAQDEKKRTD